MQVFLHYILELRDLMSTHILFTLGIMLLAGYMLGIMIARIGLPEITGYIIAGILIGESALGIVPFEMTASMKVVNEVALGFIALTIGSEFSYIKLKRIGKMVFSITVFQLLFAFIIILSAMLLIGLELPFALIIASIGTASSPAVIVAVVQSLRAHGTFIDALYGVVALLDAGTVVLFGISFSIAAGIMGLTGAGVSNFDLFIGAISEVFFSIIIGIIMGLIIHFSIKTKTRNNEILLIILGIAFTFTAIAIVFHLSPLLINMTAGAIMVNISARHNRVFRILEPMTPPIYALFFILAGSELRISLLLQSRILLIGGVYILSRTLSKYLGVYIGACLTHAGKNIKKYLGLCMFPQAGVSLGLILFVQASPVSEAMTDSQVFLTNTLVNIVLLSVFFNQLIGPPIAKYAIIKGNKKEADLWN